MRLITEIARNPIVFALGCLSLLVCLFFIFREIILWYWKISQIEELLQQQIENDVEKIRLLRSIDNKLNYSLPDNYQKAVNVPSNQI